MDLFKFVQDPNTHEKWIQTQLTGKLLMNMSILNKGTAFSNEERKEFGLLGKLPIKVETLDEQVQRVYEQYRRYDSNLQKNIYLNNLLDRNEVLFYRLVSEHISEMLPVIYTPIVGTAVKKYSKEFRHPRGLYLNYVDQEHIDEMLNNRTHSDIDIIVVSDAERILGIGDQGIGGMDIPIAKLMVYTLCGGIFPGRTLPILLDVGTNNEELLSDPLYLGWRHERIRGQAYDDFIERFVSTVKRKFPNVFLHWEDFGRDNARRLLDHYREHLCTFNDDIQGTGAVACAAVLAAVKAKHEVLADQKVVVFGAGSAGVGIVDQLCSALVSMGMSLEEARKRFYLVDRPGLLVEDQADLQSFQKPYARLRQEVAGWDLVEPGRISLGEVVEHVHPTVLIGCSAVPGAFSERIVRQMASFVDRPIILPLSNPTERAEAKPLDLLEWTDGAALIATGSPFGRVDYRGRSVKIAQGNNALVFPGIGLGVTTVRAKRLTDEMIWAACETLSDAAPVLKKPLAPILPSLEKARSVCKKIALAVGKVAIRTGQASLPISEEQLAEHIERSMWEPQYLPIKKG